MSNKCLYLCLLLLTFWTCKPTVESDQTNEKKEETKLVDPLAPTSDGSQALSSHLRIVTLCTNHLDAIKRFYIEGMGLSLEGPLAEDEATKTKERALWGIPDDLNWDMYLIHRKEVPELLQIRLLVFAEETPLIHESYSARELGPFSIGFPNIDQTGLDQRLRDLGFISMAPLQEGRVPRPDGTSYRYIETIYQAPDFVHAVGIERKDGMPPLAPVDSTTKLGGPGYSAQVLNDSDKELAFYTEVLGQELRSDRHWKSSPGSALGIEEGVPFRFSLVYAEGGGYNHLLFLDYEDDVFTPTKVAPRVPNRGLGMWTFESPDLNEIKRRAIEKEIEILQEPTQYQDLILGNIEVMTLIAPEGFLIEVYQRI